MDHKEFETLFKTYYPDLFSFAKSIVQEEEDAKDVIHEVFIKLWRNKDQIDQSLSLRPYLFRAIHNQCLNALRNQKLLIPFPDFDTDHLDEALEEIEFYETKELQNRISTILHSLPDRCREVFELSRYEGKKNHEIAQVLGISTKAVEAQITKALKTFRSELKDYLLLPILIGSVILF